MREQAWIAFAAACMQYSSDPSGAARFADALLKEFDARFSKPAPKRDDLPTMQPTRLDLGL